MANPGINSGNAGMNSGKKKFWNSVVGGSRWGMLFLQGQGEVIYFVSIAPG